MQANKIYLPDVIGKGYKDFWHFRGRYNVVKGSRGSKKSKTAALKIIYGMMKHPQANTIVIRKTFRTLKDSCFKELKWAINRFGVAAHWQAKESPLEITYKPTGQKIYFRGMDDPIKITSITVESGVLCWAWLEEAFELKKEEEFDYVNESLRGKLPEGLFYQWLITFNPWNKRIWLKSRFFDIEDPKILTQTTTYLCNEFLDQESIDEMEALRLRNPKRFEVAGLGNWGSSEGVIYENIREEEFDINNVKHLKPLFGLDFGWTNPNALFCGYIDLNNYKIYVYDELYESRLSDEALFNRIKAMGYHKERVIADNENPRSINKLDDLGMYRIEPARKGKDSVLYGIRFIQDFEIIVHPQCVNFLTEIETYVWNDDKPDEPVRDMAHLMDAMRYAVEPYMSTSGFSTG